MNEIPRNRKIVSGLLCGRRECIELPARKAANDARFLPRRALGWLLILTGVVALALGVYGWRPTPKVSAVPPVSDWTFAHSQACDRPTRSVVLRYGGIPCAD